MGGRGSGGRRPGSGRKPDLSIVPALSEQAPNYAPPDHMGDAEKTVWLTEAPTAVRRGTLTGDELIGFESLCYWVVEDRRLRGDPDASGADKRGASERATSLLLRFDLIPNGKPHGTAGQSVEKPKNSLEQLKERRAAMRMVRGA